MTPDAALDQVAFLVGLRLMGPDARRRLRLALVRSPEFTGPAGFDVERVDRLDALLDGRRPPDTLQDYTDLARAERERADTLFDPGFWLARLAELTGAGFPAQPAARLIEDVRGRVDPSACVVPPEEQKHDLQPQA